MSTTVDERVVSMRFDNKDFEKNVNTSMNTIEKLKQSLLFKGATNGFKDIDKAAKDVDMGHLEKGVESVRAKFSALEVMGVTVLANITNSALNAGKKIASALTIEPIKAGFSEYETQMNAVQTILANTSNKGTTLTQVNKALDELNTYADKTIYNFTEMTRNIGTFTAAGVDLNTSVSAIKGIANLAAVSGSNSQQASTAMYQLSQALSSGTVKLMDWNSVVNAGMGGQVFQDSLKETAKLHGKNVDAMIEKEGSFRETLKDGWLTADILTETLAKFTGDLDAAALKKQGYTDEQIKEILELGEMANNAATKVKTLTQLWDTLKEAAQSGWSQSWRIIVGDFEESKAFFTEVSDTIGALIGESADARNKLLSGGLSSGWKQFLEAGIADEEGFKESLKKVAKEAGTDLDKLQESLGKDASFEDTIAAGFKDGSLNADIFSKSVSDLTTKMRGMSEEELEAAGYTQEHVKQIEKLEAGLKDGSVSMEEFVDKMSKPSGRENLIDSLRNSFQAIMKIVTPIKEAFNEIFPPATADQLYNLTVRIKEFTDQVRQFTEKHGPNIKSTFKGLFAVIDIIVTVVKEVVGGVTTLVGSLLGLSDGILGVTGSFGDMLSGFRDTIKESGIISSVFGAITKVLQGFIKIITPGFNGLFNVMSRLFDFISKIGSGIGDVISNILNSGNLESGLDIFNSGLLATILLGIKKFIKGATDAFEDLGGIAGILDGVKGSLEAWQQNLKADTLKKIATAIAILAAAIWVISTIDPVELASSLGAVTALFGELMGSMAIFDKMGGSYKGIGKAVTGMIGISTAVLILAAALKVISTLSWNELAVGLTGLTVGLGALIGAVYLLPDKEADKAAKTIKKLSSALLVLAVAIKLMSTMSWNEMAVGLTAMAAGLGALIGTMYALPKDVTSKTAGLIGIATAMLILSGALKVMSSMSWDEVGRGLATLAGSLLLLVTAMKFMTNAVSGAASLLIISGALVVLSGALKIMASMSWEEIGRSLVTLAGSLLILTTAMMFMSGNLAGAAALFVVSTALIALSAALTIMGSMSWGEIAKSLITLAGALAIIGAAGLLLAPAAMSILAIGAAVALIGVGCIAAGAGLMLVAAGITALAMSLATGTTAIVAGLAAILLGIVNLAGDIIIGVCKAITGSAGAIGEALLALIVTACDVIIQALPKIGEALAVIITEVLKVIVDAIPKILECVGVLLDELLNFIIEYVPKMVDAGMKMLIGFLDGIANNIGNVVSSAVRIVTEFLGAIGREYPKMVDAGFKMVINLINGIADSCRENIPLIMDAMGNLATSIIDGLVQGIKDGISNIGTAFKELALSGLNTFKKILGINSPSKEFIAQGGFIVGGLMNGIKKNASDAIGASKKLGVAVLDGFKEVLGINSPSLKFEKEGGRPIVQGIAEGIKKDMSAEEAAEKKAQNILTAFQKYFDLFNLDTSKFDKEFSLWETTDGLNATPAERNAKRIETVNNKIVKAVESTKFANYEYLEMVDKFGKESKQARESYNRYLDRQMEEAKLRIEAASLISEAADAECEAVENQNDVLDSYINYRNSLDSNEINDTIRDNANLADLNQQLENLKPLEQSTFKVWEELKKLAEEGKVSAETVLSAKTAYLDICKQIEDKEDEIADTHRSIADRKHEEIAALKESREKDAEIWEQMYGENATDEERDSYYLNKLKQDENDAYNDMLIEQAEFERIKSEYAKDTAEYIAAENRYKQAVIDSNDAKQATREYQKQAAERERDQLIELNELASSNADLEYQLWEATSGREATGVEKKSMKLGFLAKQVVAQAEIVKIAQREWENAKADEKAAKYNEYLNEQLALANLQSEILDIEEENVKREKLAKNEYEKYIDKYEKYYLANGMTRADLERDAKLISGYDPTAKTESMVTKTTEKLSSESTITNFLNIGTSYTTAVTEGIQNGVSTVVDSATTMVKTCIDILKDEDVQWKEVGASLVEGFVDGIESKAQEAIDAANQIAESTRNAIESILNSSLDYEPTITPVLDMSNVVNGLGTFTTGTALGLAHSISASRSVDDSNVSVSTSGTGTTTYTFTQNNYSPKALSSVEIYRQTKNQLSTLKGMVTT